jgi:hypothetical protein
MRILLCSTASFALGETYTIALFAKELLNSNNKCFFIAPQLGKNYLLTFGFAEEIVLKLPTQKELGDQFNIESNKKLFDAFVKKAKPDFVIIADWHHFRSDGLYYYETYSLNWFDKKIPIGTFDHIGFAPNGRDNIKDSFLEKIEKKIPDKKTHFKEFLPVPERISFIIRPCPHANNNDRRDGNCFKWAVLKDNIKKEEIIVKKIRDLYKLKNERVIFQPIGVWQDKLLSVSFSYLLEKAEVDYNYYEDTYFPIIFHYLSFIEEEIAYIVISADVKKEKRIKKGNVTLIKIPPLNNNLFMEHLSATDLFITDNLMSVNLGKAVFNNILPIVFKNSLYQDSKKEIVSPFKISDFISEKISFLKENNLIFPFRTFPLGMCELEDMYQNNPFSDCFIEEEVFDEEANIKLFKDIFSKGKHKNIFTAQNEYIKKNNDLLSAEEILMLSAGALNM